MVDESSNQAWVEEEFADVHLGDVRLDLRLRDTATKLSAQPGASINQACEEWSDTQASYRLFDNKKTTADKIYAPHYKRTAERARGHKRLFAIQDTTYLNYSHHPGKKGLGPIGTKKQKNHGLVMHNTLLMSETGTPLGLIDQAVWVRPKRSKKMSRYKRKSRPIEEKESYKWLKALTQSVDRIPSTPHLISICDSEADIFELFAHARALETDLLVRAAQDRALCEPETGRLWAILEALPPATTFRLSVPARNREPARTADLSLHFTSVTLNPPELLGASHEPITLDAVLVWEEHPPAGVKKPLRWLLLTSVPVSSVEEALERTTWYRLRWQIEVYHKVLKSGCRVEKTQLATRERLLPYLALLSIIAWRLFWLTLVARHDPDAPATVVLADHEWQALYVFLHRTDSLPPQPPSVAQVIRWIAQLGGFLARNSDGDPGVTVIWRGWQRLSDIASAWLLFHPYPYVCKG